MIIFAAPHYLLLLLLIPFFFLGMGLWLWGRRRRLRRFGDEALVNELMPSWSRGKLWVRTVLLSLAFFFFVIGLSRPQIGAKLKEHKIKGAEIMIVLDVSNSMLAQDYSPDRLERAKLAISRITDKLKDDRIGLIVFAGTSFVQLPITSDYVSAKMFLNSISTESIPIQGTAIGDAICCLRIVAPFFVTSVSIRKMSSPTLTPSIMACSREYSLTTFWLKKAKVRLSGVAVRPMMKASKYSST